MDGNYQLILFFLILILLKSIYCIQKPQILESPLNQTITIDMQHDLGLNQTLFFHAYKIRNACVYNILIRNFNGNNSDMFGILQVHSHLYPVVLTNSNVKPEVTVTGTNIGFMVFNNSNFTISSAVDMESTNIAVAFVIYNKTTSPIPGGCENNPAVDVMPVENYPVIKVRAFSAVNVNSTESNCARNDLKYELRYKYLKIGDMGLRTYFNGIREMITVKSSSKKGYLSFSPENNRSLTRFFARVRGTGIVFQTIAIGSNGEAAYIPAVTYSCQPLLMESDCKQHNFLQIMYYIICLPIGLVLMTAMLLPKVIIHFSVGLFTGMCIGILFSAHLDADKQWTFFITALIALVIAKGVVCTNTTNCCNITNSLMSFWISYITFNLLFYISIGTFDLPDYLQLALIVTIICSTIFISVKKFELIPMSTSLGNLLCMLSTSYLADGKLYEIIEHPYYYLTDYMYRAATKIVLIAPQDMICVCLGLTFVIGLLLIYQHFGDIWQKIIVTESVTPRYALQYGTMS